MKNDMTRNNYFLVVFSVVLMMFFPASIQGRVISNIWIIRNGLGIIVAVLLALSNKLKRNNFLITLIFFALLMILTVTTSLFYPNNDFYISISSLSAEITTFTIWCITFQNTELESQKADHIINFLSWTLIIWGWGLVIQNTFITNFTKSFYLNLGENTFNNMIIIRGKPVMSFGTHSMAAFFVLLIFFLNSVMLKEGKNSIFRYITMGLLMALEIPMRSNTAILALAVMVFLFIWATHNWKAGMVSIVAIGMVAGYLYFSGSLVEYILSITQNSSSSNHGVEARYFSGLYENNFNLIMQYGGVGFLRSYSEFFRMNDSAIIYLLSQGNIFAPIIAFGSMYFFFKRNLKKYHVITFAIFMIWEIIATTTYISPRMVFSEILVIFMINNVIGRDGNGEEYIQTKT